MKFCKDCKHSNVGSSYFAADAICKVSPAAPRNHITGREMLTSDNTCESMRRQYNPCGPDAKLYEPKLLERLLCVFN